MTDAVSVLLVDNEPSFAELAAEMLVRVDDTLDVTTVTNADEALGTVEKSTVECIVSDYDMPGMNGLELLEAVRTRNEDLPFILFTGKGSEEIASEAIAAGVTQYLQKKSGREQYTLLANQIRNAVSQYRTETELRESERRHERTLTVLHETTRDLMRAGTKEEIYRAAVDTAGDILDVPIVATYGFDPTDGVLRYAAATERTAEALDPERSFERGEGLVWEAFSGGEAAYYEDVRAEIEGDPETLSRSEVIVPLGTHGVLVAGSEQAGGFDETMIELIQILAANTEAALDRAEREQLLREHDRTLTRKNEELTRLNHTNELVREITRGVAQATTREEIERTVCERLTDAERYLFAWIAPERDPSAPKSGAAVDATYVDRIRDDGEAAPEARLVRRALADERVHVVRNVLDDREWEPRRAEALTHGFQTVIAVPLTGRERRYGALVVHAVATDAVTESEREVLAELGETIGHAIRSVERTRAMVTDERVELELACADERLLLNRLSIAADGPVTLAGILEREQGRVVCFVGVDDPPLDELVALDDAWTAVDRVSVVSESDDAALLEVSVETTPFLEVCREYDARVLDAESVEGTATVTLQVPQRVDARSLVETIRDGYPDTELAARRETSRRRPTGRLDRQVEERLTAKQFEALQAAHYSGFFDWPRESTGEELAATLDVSPPTFHYHLRAAERKLVDLALEGRSN
ncbi:bacterio-opsin activator domain-containing protein [Halovivax sp.]|uniref:bacterio-opsin activator domain-containing protein n=1 Tax=Halovivax sp. TaxID=1935978 RepID=UPI0025C0CD61|nr:bacterio-opsin activator domain-containing protein [Halovivax sp.]